jgi:hypothetical protein
LRTGVAPPQVWPATQGALREGREGQREERPRTAPGHSSGRPQGPVKECPWASSWGLGPTRRRAPQLPAPPARIKTPRGLPCRPEPPDPSRRAPPRCLDRRSARRAWGRRWTSAGCRCRGPSAAARCWVSRCGTGRSHSSRPARRAGGFGGTRCTKPRLAYAFMWVRRRTVLAGAGTALRRGPPAFVKPAPGGHNRQPRDLRRLTRAPLSCRTDLLPPERTQ